MRSSQGRAAMVTGANSGFGFETARQLAEAGWGRVVLACRTEEKALLSRERLVSLTGRDPFESLVMDTAEVASADFAAGALAERGGQFDFVVLNAGASGSRAEFNTQGIEITWASTLVGHHVLCLRMLEKGLLAPHSRLVIAGSEAARGSVPGMKVHDIRAMAEQWGSGDVVETICRLTRVEDRSFNNAHEYATAKLVVAWWAAALSRRLPAEMAVNTVSPGAALGTRFTRNAPLLVKYFMLPMLRVLGPLLGLAGSIERGAARYLEFADRPASDTGNFYATASMKKLVGPLGVQKWPDYLVDEELQEAAFEALCRITGVRYPSLSAAEASA